MAATAQLCGCRDTAVPRLVWTPLPAVPDQEGFASAYAGVSDGALLVAGGANFPAKRPWEGGVKVWYDDIFVLESPGGEWKRAGKLPRPLAYGVSVTTSQGVVCVGGGDAREHVRDVFLLTWENRSIRRQDLAPLPTPLANACGVTIGERIFIYGGQQSPGDTAAEARGWTLDLSQAAPVWEPLPPHPGPGRMLAQAGAIGDTLVVCGGVSLAPGPDGRAVRTYLGDAYAYRKETGWRVLADMPRTVAGAPTPLPSTSDGELLLISGDDGSRTHLAGPDHPGFLREVWAYDLANDRWSRWADGPLTRATAPTVRWNDRWVIVSGEHRPGYRSAEVWAIGEKK